jgi:hypothetical protein
MLSMRDVSEARFALFEGQVETARTEVDAALTRINAAVQEAEIYAIDLKSPEKDDWYVPFDTFLRERRRKIHLPKVRTSGKSFTPGFAFRQVHV